MSDIVKRLRNAQHYPIFVHKEAPDEIERLRGELSAYAQINANANAEIERLRAEIEPLRIALGLLTTIKPTMEIDVTDPVGMAQQIAVHVADEIERLRQQRNDFAASAIKRDAEIERLRGENDALKDEVELKAAALTGTSRVMGEEIERLRGALTQTSEAWGIGQNTIAQLRAAMEVRERDHLEKTAEIERLRGHINWLNDANDGGRLAIDEIERLRQLCGDALFALNSNEETCLSNNNLRGRLDEAARPRGAG